jgi:hypothetical protein
MAFNTDPLISASQVARIIGMSHWCPVKLLFLKKKKKNKHKRIHTGRFHSFDAQKWANLAQKINGKLYSTVGDAAQWYSTHLVFAQGSGFVTCEVGVKIGWLGG